jgi:protein-tyrosine-phosphatase
MNANLKKAVYKVRVCHLKVVKVMRVLFVCSGNAHRSPLAEALLKKLRPDLEVESAGISTSIPVSEEIKEYLAKENAGKYLKRVPENLTSKRLRDYDLIVAMEQRHKDAVVAMCAECEQRTVVWNVEDPYPLGHKDAERIYKQVEDKVRELAESLQSAR